MQTSIDRAGSAAASASRMSARRPARRVRGIRSAIAVAAAAAALALSGCAAAEPIELSPETVVIDVRTPDEYAAGHLDGALNLDLTSGELAAEIPALDAADEYVVYCKSGNRSAQAAQLMEEAGLEVTDAGSMQQAADATGLPIVQ